MRSAIGWSSRSGAALMIVTAVAGLWLFDAGKLFAARPVLFVQGQGPECKCILAGVFPSVIASSYDSMGYQVGIYGAGSWFIYHQNDPVGWGPFLDEDNLWVKARCEMQPDAGNPVEPVEIDEAFELELTPSEDWWEGDEYREWLDSGDTDPWRKWEAHDYYPLDGHCPCKIWIRWEGEDGSDGSVMLMCSKEHWQTYLPHPGSATHGIAHNVLPGFLVHITARLVCGDCVLELTETATMFEAP